jgi:hypothetical protein
MLIQRVAAEAVETQAAWPCRSDLLGIPPAACRPCAVGGIVAPAHKGERFVGLAHDPVALA